MTTWRNLYFIDVIGSKQKIVSALMWQSLVSSVIHIHCLYPLQLRKLSSGNTWHTLAASATWTHSNKSDHHSPELCLDYGEIQETETMNLLTGTNSTVLFLLLWKLTAPLSHFWLCCTYIFCCLQCQDNNFMYLIFVCSESTLTA